MKTRSLVLAAVFCALMSACALISIPVGPVPITLQSMFAVLSGILLGPYIGMLSQLLYLLLGLAGLPVFAGGSGGIASISSPSFGYLIGFVLAAAVSGFITGKSAKPSFARLILAAAAGSLILYLPGLLYMFVYLNDIAGIKLSLAKTLKTGFLIFIPGDMVKAVIAVAVAVKAVPAVKKVPVARAGF